MGDEFDFREVVEPHDFREVIKDDGSSINPVPESGTDVKPFISPEFVPLNAGDSGKKKGLVLSGGGAKGAYQAGVLRVLKEKGLLSDVGYISGVSIGAINMALYLMDDMDGMDKVWDDMDTKEIISLDTLTMSGDRLYFSRERITKILTDFISFDKISKSEIKTFAGVSRIIGADQYIGEYLSLNGRSDEDIRTIITASSSLPVIHEPVSFEGKLYMDGGPTDNEPVKPLYDIGVRDFIVIGLQFDRKFDYSKYPGAHFEVIYPSKDLGGLFTGTLNFEDDNKNYIRKLGLKDAERYIKVNILKDEGYILMEEELKKLDHRALDRENHADNVYNYYQDRISTSMDYIKNLEEKYKDY